MRICPNCFTSLGSQNSSCPMCGYYDVGNRDSRALPAGIYLKRRYYVGRVLGVGGFGVTYIAYDIARRMRVAIKEYFPIEWAVRSTNGLTIVPNSQTLQHTYREGQEKFVNEANILLNLQDVPAVVKVLDFFSENQTAYMVMELLDGYTLKGLLQARGTNVMGLEEALRIFREVGMTLVEIHKKMLLHRDISPNNIMITKDGRVHLIDFGATRAYGLISKKSMSVLIKPGFAPLEQYSKSGNQGPWTDIYALAATFYFLLSGSKPPEAPDRMAGVPLVPLDQKVPGIPWNISQAISHALECDYQRRPQTMDQFLKEMNVRVKRPYVRIDTGKGSQKCYFGTDHTLTIGRSPAYCSVVLRENEVGRIHCQLYYDEINNRFVLEGKSVNKIYVARGEVGMNRRVHLQIGEWFFIRTKKRGYMFYLEVE